jgi:hypothetical protein
MVERQICIGGITNDRINKVQREYIIHCERKQGKSNKKGQALNNAFPF